MKNAKILDVAFPCALPSRVWLNSFSCHSPFEISLMPCCSAANLLYQLNLIKDANNNNLLGFVLIKLSLNSIVLHISVLYQQMKKKNSNRQLTAKLSRTHHNTLTLSQVLTYFFSQSLLILVDLVNTQWDQYLYEVAVEFSYSYLSFHLIVFKLK